MRPTTPRVKTVGRDGQTARRERSEQRFTSADAQPRRGLFTGPGGRHAAATGAGTVVAAGHRAAIVENDRGGDFTGSNGQLFSPLYDVDGLLTYSQIGWLQQSAGALGNFALGQRWIVGDWLLGYNTALDSDFARQRNRGSVGAEAWGDYLRFSTNYYYPLSALSQQPGNGVFSAARHAVTTSRRKAICRFTARSAVRSAMSSTWATMSICSAAVKAKRSARHAAGAQLHPGTAGDDEGAA